MGRTVQTKTTTTTSLDLSVLANVTLIGTDAVRIGFDSASAKAAGFAKTANMFLRVLMTLKGSNALKPLEGTEFQTVIEANVSDDKVMYALIAGYVDDATKQVQAYQQAAGTPEESQLGATKISAFFFSPAESRLDFSVDLFNPLGERFTLEIPSIVIT